MFNLYLIFHEIIFNRYKDFETLLNYKKLQKRTKNYKKLHNPSPFALFSASIIKKYSRRLP